jgi:signal transduction histidine kinase
LEVFQKYLKVIIKESYRCKGIIDSLLNFSRKSEGFVGAVDLNALLQEVLMLVRHKSRYELIEIQESFQHALPPVSADGAGLRQVFMNLLLNAYQSISGAGTVQVSTFTDGDMGVVQIKDSGSGIAAEHLAQIWNPFFTTKVVGQGLGLGLAITYNILQRQGGEIQVESKQGKGSIFTVRLPLCPN